MRPRRLGLLAALLALSAGCDDFAAFSGTADRPEPGADLGVEGSDFALPADLADGRMPDLTLGTWRTESPGIGEDLNDVWGSGPDDVWAVGQNGVVLHRRVGGWRPETTGAKETLWAVWGAGPRELWMAGDDGRVISYDGTFHLASTGEHTTIWGGAVNGTGSAMTANTMVGAAGSVYSWKSGAWTHAAYRGSSSDLLGVWSRGVATQWVVGGAGLIVQLINGDGASEQGAVAADLLGVWGDEAGTLVAVGTGGTAVRRAGLNKWEMAQNSDTRNLRAVTGCGLGAAELWAVGTDGVVLRSLDQGRVWKVVNANIAFRLNGVWCAAPGDVYAVGVKGLVVHLTPGG